VIAVFCIPLYVGLSMQSSLFAIAVCIHSHCGHMHHQHRYNVARRCVWVSCDCSHGLIDHVLRLDLAWSLICLTRCYNADFNLVEGQPFSRCFQAWFLHLLCHDFTVVSEPQDAMHEV